MQEVDATVEPIMYWITMYCMASVRRSSTIANLYRESKQAGGGHELNKPDS